MILNPYEESTCSSESQYLNYDFIFNETLFNLQSFKFSGQMLSKSDNNTSSFICKSLTIKVKKFLDVRWSELRIFQYIVQYLFVNIMSMEDQRVEPMQQEQQIMIMIDDLQQNEEDQDLIEQLVAEPILIKQKSICYDYKPASITQEDIEIVDTSQLKTSNRSTQTCADSQGPVRRCFCSKTRCQKNYCECFKQGLPCTNDCECISCGNKEQLFLISRSQKGTKCKCQKSHCLKKYCQCHSSGKRCSSACKCFECENMQEPIKQQKQESLYHSCHQIDHLLSFNI